MLRVVLDTNVFISALLFEGDLSGLVSLWQKRKFLYLISRPILNEYLRVLTYPKFQLTDQEIKCLVEEDLLPYVEIVKEAGRIAVPNLKDPDDRMFLEASVWGKADYLVTGDRAVAELRKFKGVEIIRPAEFLLRIL